MARRSGLEAFRSALRVRPLPPTTVDFFVATALESVVNCVADSIERCREIAIGLTVAVELPPEKAKKCIVAMCEQIPREKSEELRLAMLENLLELSNKHSDVGTAEIVEILAVASKDPFPEAKMAAAALVRAVVVEEDKELVAATAANCKHQRARVRASAIDAIGHLAPLSSSSLWASDIVPTLQAASCDRSSLVRESLVTAVVALLPLERVPEQGKLAGILLELRSDDDENIKRVANSYDVEPLYESILKDSVGPSCRHWTRERRVRGGLALSQLCSFDSATPLPLLELAAKLCGDDDAEVLEAGRSAAATLYDATSQLDAYVEFILPKLSGEEDGARAESASAYRARYCEILAAALDSRKAASLCSPKVARALADYAWLGGPASPLLASLRKLVAQNNLAPDTERDLVIASLLAKEDDDDDETIASWWPDFSQACSRRCADAATDRLARTGDPEEAARGRELLSALIRTAPAACRSRFEDVFSRLVLPLCDSSQPVEKRIAGIALLHAIVVGGPVADPDAVVGAAVAPNLVWQSGRAALVARKAALAVLHALLSNNDDCGSDNNTVLVELLPSLRTCLDDYDSSSRELALADLALVFRKLKSLDRDSINDTYPALLKRLDDSSDTIRVASCGAATDFFKLASGALSAGGTALEYTTEQLLVHLDDSDPTIQEAVFEALRALIENVTPSQSSFLENKIKAVKTSHRNPAAYCDKLLLTLS